MSARGKMKTSTKMIVIGILMGTLIAGMVGLNHIQGQPSYQDSRALRNLEARGSGMIESIQENRRFLTETELRTTSNESLDQELEDAAQAAPPAEPGIIWTSSSFVKAQDGRRIIRMAWEPPPGDVSRYHVLRNDSSHWQMEEPTRDLIDHDVEPGNIYQYEVEAHGPQGIIARGTRVHIFPETKPVETELVETPAVETPTVETPTVETPTVETPTVETPTVETPTIETPTVEGRMYELDVRANRAFLKGQDVIVLDWDTPETPAGERIFYRVTSGDGSTWTTHSENSFVIADWCNEPGVYHFLVIAMTSTGYLAGQTSAEILPQSMKVRAIRATMPTDGSPWRDPRVDQHEIKGEEPTIVQGAALPGKGISHEAN